MFSKVKGEREGGHMASDARVDSPGTSSGRTRVCVDAASPA
jgi:hypothetical protein